MLGEIIVEIVEMANNEVIKTTTVYEDRMVTTNKHTATVPVHRADTDILELVIVELT